MDRTEADLRWDRIAKAWTYAQGAPSERRYWQIWSRRLRSIGL